MLFLGKAFRFLAATGALEPARAVRIGDVTCDSDGRYPPERFGDNAGVLLPDVPDLHVVVEGVGAYQEILSGVRGAHHCGLLEAVELILEARAGGEVHGRLMPRQRYVDAAHVLGYSEDAVEPLRIAMA
jgi:arginine decarboxylase-like protein